MHDGSTPVFMAAQMGHVDVIKYLAEHGADLNTPMHDGRTPVYIAAQMGHVEVIKTLVGHGADLNTPDEDGITPVYVAANHGHLDVVKTLVKFGADLNTPTNDGSTPVLGAAQEGHADVIKLLYKRGANMKPDSTSLSIKQLAQKKNHTQAVEMIDKILNKLTNKKCDYCGSSSYRLKVCSMCWKGRYCSRQCQVQDYKKHKKEYHSKNEEQVI
jgi:ankyrin repeat protein